MASYRLNEEKMFCDISDNVAIIINNETGIYYGMNGCGTTAFENLIKGVDSENVFAALASAGAADKAKFDAFIADLIAKELVVAGEPSEAEAKIDAALAAADNCEPTVTEYSDAQELLLADPIHDVKDETGWLPDAGALEDDEEKLKKKKENEKIVIKKAEN